MSVRLKLIGVSFLLCVALACTVFAAAGTVRAYQSVQENHRLVMAGDVSTVRAWMTLPYISRVYHVPAPCLYGSLHISASALRKHATLDSIATYYKKPVNSLVHDVQRVILDYRHRCFLVYDVVGEILGALLPLSLGYVFGTSWEAVGDLLGSFSIFILAVLVVLFLSYQTFRMFRRARQQRALQQASQETVPLEVSAVSPRLSGSDQASSS